MIPAVTSRLAALSKRPTVRNVSLLMTGTAGGQLIIALSAPILTRIYSPDQMGVLSVFTSILSPILAFATLKFGEASQVPEDPQEARALNHLSLASVFVVALLSFLAVLLFRDEIAHLMSSPRLSNYLLLLPVAILAAGTFNTMTSWCIRVKAFGLIARARFKQSVAIVVMQIILGLAGLGGWGLIGGDSSGRFVGATSQLRLFLNAREKGQAINKDIGYYVALIRRYKDFPLYSVPSGLLNSLSTNIPTYFLAVTFGPGPVGFYALGQRVLGLPLNLIANAVSQVFISQAADLRRSSIEALSARTRMICFILMGLGAVITIPIAVFAPQAFVLAFGKEWFDAGVYLRALTPLLWAQFSFSPLSAVLVVLERQDLHALREALRVILMGGALVVMIALDLSDPVQIVQVFGVVGALPYIIGGALVWYSIHAARHRAS